MSGLHVDWASLALVTVVTVTVTALVMLIVSLAARMLGEVRLKREAGRAQGLHAAEVAAGFFLAFTTRIMLFFCRIVRFWLGWREIGHVFFIENFPA